MATKKFELKFFIGKEEVYAGTDEQRVFNLDLGEGDKKTKASALWKIAAKILEPYKNGTGITNITILELTTDSNKKLNGELEEQLNNYGYADKDPITVHVKCKAILKTSIKYMDKDYKYKTVTWEIDPTIDISKVLQEITTATRLAEKDIYHCTFKGKYSPGSLNESVGWPMIRLLVLTSRGEILEVLKNKPLKLMVDTVYEDELIIRDLKKKKK